MEANEREELKPGTRVRLLSASAGVELRSSYGTVVRPDAWLDYYVIRLDEPVVQIRADGSSELLPEVCESRGNVAIVS
jgi:hypothetical protein